MANEPTNGADPKAAPAPTKPKHKLSTQGRKPTHRSTKAELNREKLTTEIITCLVAGKTIDETADVLNISRKYVERIRGSLSEEFLGYFTAAKTNEISSLIEQGIRAQLKAMIKMVEVTENDTWLEAQRAPELATFFGVVNDKTIRVLAAIERADERLRLEREAISESREDSQGGPTVRREPQKATQGA